MGKGRNGQLIIMLNIKRSKSYSTQPQCCPRNRSWRSRENVHVIYEALKILLHYPCHQDCNENGKWHQLNPFSLQSLDCNLVFSPQENAKWDFKQKRGQRSMENKEANRNWKVKKKRCMIEFPVFVGGFLFTLEMGTEHRTVRIPTEVLAKNL